MKNLPPDLVDAFNQAGGWTQEFVDGLPPKRAAELLDQGTLYPNEVEAMRALTRKYADDPNWNDVRRKLNEQG